LHIRLEKSECSEEVHAGHIIVSVFSEEEVELPDLDYLRTMTHIVFVDFDNWSNFFGHLPGHLNQGTFIWGFQGMVNKENI
jgi:hypothetical protein